MAAQLLQGIYGYCSGDRVLFNYSETLRWSLIQTGKQVGLFHDIPRRTPSTKNESVEAQWNSWIAFEGRKRLGWAIHVCLICLRLMKNLYCNLFLTSW